MAKKKPSPALAKPPEFLAKTPKAKSVTLRQDKDGYYVHTQRSRSKSYPSPGRIPKSVIEQIEATG